MDASTFPATPWPTFYVLGPDSVVCELEQPEVELHLLVGPAGTETAYWLDADGRLLAFVEVGRA